MRNEIDIAALYNNMKAENQKIALEFLNGFQIAKIEPTKKFFTRKQIAAGEGYACILGCKKLTKTYERSLLHATTNAALQEQGHIEVA